MNKNNTHTFIKKLTPTQKNLRKRILEISFEGGVSHIGSCFSSIDIILAIYRTKKKNEKFILSAGHSGVALYVVLEKFKYLKNVNLNNFNIHPDRNNKYDISVSTGSLGQGLPIAVGIALSNRKKTVYCMISDGECAEGSIWEAVRIASENNLNNLKIIVNANGYGAYGAVSEKLLSIRFKSFGASVIKAKGHNLLDLERKIKKKSKKPNVIVAKTIVDQLPFLNGQDAHYKVMTKNEYTASINLLR